MNKKMYLGGIGYLSYSQALRYAPTNRGAGQPSWTGSRVF